MCRCPESRQQRGASLIEFAFVLPLLLILLIGTIYFGYVFVLQSAAQHAAQQAATSAVAVDPVAVDDYDQAVRNAVAQSVFRSLSWLPGSVADGVTSGRFACDDDDGDSGSASCSISPIGTNPFVITVTINVSGGSSPLLPEFVLPPFGRVPPAGLSQLTGVAEVTL